jgi:hypothetical protein
VCGAEIDCREFSCEIRQREAGFFSGGVARIYLYLWMFFLTRNILCPPTVALTGLSPEGRNDGAVGGKAVPERMALSDQTGQKPRCVRRARKKLLAHVLGVHLYRTALTERMDERCLFVKYF